MKMTKVFATLTLVALTSFCHAQVAMIKPGTIKAPITKIKGNNTIVGTKPKPCNDKPEYDDSYPLPNTDTAVVVIGLDDDGMPVIYEDRVFLYVGQRVVLTGPENFSIRFPEDSPFEDREYKTDNGVINLTVPKSAARYFRDKNHFVRFKYDIIHRDKVLDPYFIIMPD